MESRDRIKAQYAHGPYTCECADPYPEVHGDRELHEVTCPVAQFAD